MIVGDWVECGEIEFRVVKIFPGFLMADDVHGYLASACTKLPTQLCPRCDQQVPNGQVQSRYSYTVYAGKMCDECAFNKYRDHCEGGCAADLDEALEPEDYY